MNMSQSPLSFSKQMQTVLNLFRDNLLLVVRGVVDDKVRMLVNTVDVYDFSSNRWYTPEALDLPIAQLRSPHVVIFKEYVYVIGGATAYPAPPEKGEAQYNRYAWRALWSDVKEAVSRAGATVILGAHTRGAEVCNMVYIHIHIYAYACMESLYTSYIYTHKRIIIHRNSIAHIIMDPVPKDELAIGAGKTAETIFSVDNTSDYIRRVCVCVCPMHVRIYPYPFLSSPVL